MRDPEKLVEERNGKTTERGEAREAREIVEALQEQKRLKSEQCVGSLVEADSLIKPGPAEDDPVSQNIRNVL